MITAKEIIELLGVSRSAAYRIIAEINATLQKEGYRTIRGKTSKKKLKEKYYLEEELFNASL